MWFRCQSTNPPVIVHRRRRNTGAFAMRPRFGVTIALSLALFLAFAAFAASARHHAANPPVPAPSEPIVSLDARRSMVVTDLALLEGFTFQRFLDQLITRSGVTNVTSVQLYRQWFDTQNPKPGLAEPSGPHCDDFTTN